MNPANPANPSNPAKTVNPGDPMNAINRNECVSRPVAARWEGIQCDPPINSFRFDVIRLGALIDAKRDESVQGKGKGSH